MREREMEMLCLPAQTRGERGEAERLCPAFFAKCLLPPTLDASEPNERWTDPRYTHCFVDEVIGLIQRSDTFLCQMILRISPNKPERF